MPPETSDTAAGVLELSVAPDLGLISEFEASLSIR